ALRAEEMSWDDYNALSPRQRAAVDANTAIINAVNADRSDWEAGRRVEMDGYDEALMALFGETGGSDMYAPRTVAVLQQLGLGDTHLASVGDLDDYLNLRALVDTDALGAANMPDDFVGPVDTRTANARHFSSAAQTALADALARGQEILDAVRMNLGEQG